MTAAAVGPTLPRVAALLASAQGRAAPAISAAVRARGELVHASSHGDAQLLPARRPLGPDDRFDVASLTKVMATTTLAALLVEGGTLELDAPAARWLPWLEGDVRAVTVRQLLAHASGLPAWRPLHARARGREAVVAAAGREPLEAAPGARVVYSDLGFILLGAALEAAGGARLDHLFDARVAAPLGLSQTTFLPAEARPFLLRCGGMSFAAARRTPERGVICGEVDDDNAWAMGGVAGHAGLFSTACDVALLGQVWLDALAGRSPFLAAATAERFAQRQPGGERALGWDLPSREGSALGSRLGRGPRGAIGHLGFTGTSLWIDRDAEVVSALLTNHVHPDGPDKPRLRAFRAEFHDAVAESLGVEAGGPA